MALDYELDGPSSIAGVGGVEIFLYYCVSRLVLRSTQPPIYRGLSVGLATLPLPSVMAVYYMWTLAFTSPVVLHCL